MSRHTLAVFLVLAIAQLFLIHQANGAANVSAGGSCAADGDTCDVTHDKMLKCVVGFCKVKIGGPCTPPGHCVAADATCPDGAGNTCECPTGKVANSEKTECIPLKKIGEKCDVKDDCVTTANACTATKCACTDSNVNLDDNSGCGKKADETCVSKSDCASNTECKKKTSTDTDKICTCLTGYTKKDTGKCEKNNATAVMTSLMLVVASFLSSRVM